jgi:hypothetical protein
MQYETAVTYSRALSVVEDFHLPATIRCQITDAIMRADDGEPADWIKVRTLAEKYGTRRHREDVASIIERIDLDAIRAAAGDRRAAEIGGNA